MSLSCISLWCYCTPQHITHPTPPRCLQNDRRSLRRTRWSTERCNISCHECPCSLVPLERQQVIRKCMRELQN
ncbi:unnamed protein product [Ixodes pacificus]